MPRYVLTANSKLFEEKLVRGEVVPRIGDIVDIDGAEYEVQFVSHVIEGDEAQLPRVVLK